MSRTIKKSINKIHKDLNKIIDIKKPLKIVIVPAKTIKISDDNYAFGVFIPYKKIAKIYIAAEKLEKYYTENDHISTIVDILSHELAHYYQWTNRLKLQERGVEVRAKKYKEKMYKILGMERWYKRYIKDSKKMFIIDAKKYDI